MIETSIISVLLNFFFLFCLRQNAALSIITQFCTIYTICHITLYYVSTLPQTSIFQMELCVFHTQSDITLLLLLKNRARLRACWLYTCCYGFQFLLLYRPGKIPHDIISTRVSLISFQINTESLRKIVMISCW